MTLLELWNDFKAWRRGEKRIAPSNQFGRVYMKFEPKIKVRVYRAATDKWEDGPEVKVK